MLELLDDLREVLWQRYLIRVQKLLADQRENGLAQDAGNQDEDDPPF